MISLLKTLTETNKEYDVTLNNYQGTLWVNNRDIFARLLGPDDVMLLIIEDKLGFYNKEGKELPLMETYQYYYANPLLGVKLHMRNGKGIAKFDLNAFRDNMLVTKGEVLTNEEFESAKDTLRSSVR